MPLFLLGVLSPPDRLGAPVPVPDAVLERVWPASLPPGSHAASVRAPRALWVLRSALSSRAETEGAVRDCARIGCSLIFLQVSGRWDAYFPSALFPRGQWWPEGQSDNLAYAIELAHARGIRVHAWVNTLLAWAYAEPPRDREHVFHQHPEWFVVGTDGRSIVELPPHELEGRAVEGYFLEPQIAAVRTELRRFVLELVTRYSLDGVHLDYIRFPSTAWGFQPELRARYRTAAGIDPLDLYLRERELTAERGRNWLAEARKDWQDWRREAITRLVRLISRDLKTVRPHAQLSAAVLGNPRSARDDFGQDWLGWLREGSLDLAVPMLYKTSAPQVMELLQAIDGHVEGTARIYAGVSLETLDASEIPAIEALMDRYGSDGVAIFSYDLLRENRRALDLLGEE